MTVTMVQRFNGEYVRDREHKISSVSGLRRIAGKYASTDGWTVGVRLTRSQYNRLHNGRSEWVPLIEGLFVQISDDGGK